MNKSLVTNAIAVSVVASGHLLSQPVVLSIGLFALSGALTNWLAVHMLFEKVPGLYGSGVVPARFESFKGSIQSLMMEQFFSTENIHRFLSDASSTEDGLDLSAVIEKTDLSAAFDGLVEVIQASSFGAMLAMLGGAEALQPLREPFTQKMKVSLLEIIKTDAFKVLLREGLSHSSDDASIRQTVEQVIEKRLDELTPSMVKDIVQTMIREHLGWLVVWGGVLGGVIGFIATASF